MASASSGLTGTAPDASAREQRIQLAYAKVGALFVEARGCASQPVEPVYTQ
jgi:hypothetical protein